MLRLLIVLGIVLCLQLVSLDAQRAPCSPYEESVCQSRCKEKKCGSTLYPRCRPGCVNGCFCKLGYARNRNNACVLYKPSCQRLETHRFGFIRCNSLTVAKC
uniref:TIL domain-containing protein n=1 Tax=Anopheles christyi TaxID=43041 RepID=A0A182K3X5_9DIPT